MFRTLVSRLAVALVAVVSVASFSACADANENKLPQGAEPHKLDPADFSSDITNPYFPLKPGTRWSFEEVDPDGTVQEVVLVATSATRKIANGVVARVVRDTVTLDGEIIEDTFDWYAQDDNGNVWYLGEDTAEFENGKVVTKEGSWEAGVDGAIPGIIMPAKPAAGMAYRQEYYKGHAEDRAEVLSTTEMVESAYGKFDNAVLTKDLVPIEPDVQEYKLYARGVGLVLAIKVSGGSGVEELISVDTVPRGTGLGPLGSPNE